MQQTSNIRRDSVSSESKNVNENTDDNQPPPPSYPSAIYKLENYDARPPPPSYSDANNPSVTYINNYPGPPLTDGTVQIVTSNPHSVIRQIPTGSYLSKKMRIYLTCNGILTIFFGLVIIGLQIGLLASHSIVYYYYGFWAGAIIISIGISTIIFKNRYQTYNYEKYFRSFIVQAIFIAVVFSFGIIIISTDTCDDKTFENDGDGDNDDTCKSSYKILNGFLLTIIALAFLQSLINTLIIGILKRRSLTNLLNVVS
jgi:hypothetical protein